MEAPIVNASNGQPNLGKPRAAYVVLNVGCGEVVLHHGPDAIQIRRLVWPYDRELKRQDIGVVAEQINGDRVRAKGCGHQIGFLQPRLHCRRALIPGPHKNVRVTVLYRRRLVDRFHRRRLYFGTSLLG
jgi:hypothetical protein